jgi:hypothetical protein
LFFRFSGTSPSNAAGKTLNNGGLSHSRLADEYGIVLGAAREDLHHAADLLVAAYHRVQPVHARQLRQVAAVLLQGLVLLLGVFARGALAAPDVHEHLQ